MKNFLPIFVSLFLLACNKDNKQIGNLCDDQIKCLFEGAYNGEFFYYKDERDISGTITSTYDTVYSGNLNILIARYSRMDSVQLTDTTIYYEQKYLEVFADTLFQMGILDTTDNKFAFPMQEYIYHSGQFRNDSVYEYNCICPSTMFGQRDCTVIRFRGKKIH